MSLYKRKLALLRQIEDETFDGPAREAVGELRKLIEQDGQEDNATEIRTLHLLIRPGYSEGEIDDTINNALHGECNHGDDNDVGKMVLDWAYAAVQPHQVMIPADYEKGDFLDLLPHTGDGRRQVTVRLEQNTPDGRQRTVSVGPSELVQLTAEELRDVDGRPLAVFSESEAAWFIPGNPTAFTDVVISSDG